MKKDAATEPRIRGVRDEGAGGGGSRRRQGGRQRGGKRKLGKIQWGEEILQKKPEWGRVAEGVSLCAADARGDLALAESDDTTKNQMHGHWLFSIRIIGFPGRRSSDSPRPPRFSPSSLTSPRPRSTVYTATPWPLASQLPPKPLPDPNSNPPSFVSGRRREKGRKNFEKKSNFVAMATGVRWLW